MRCSRTSRSRTPTVRSASRTRHALVGGRHVEAHAWIADRDPSRRNSALPPYAGSQNVPWMVCVRTSAKNGVCSTGGEHGVLLGSARSSTKRRPPFARAASSMAARPASIGLARDASHPPRARSIYVAAWASAAPGPLSSVGMMRAQIAASVAGFGLAQHRVCLRQHLLPGTTARG